MNERIRQLAEQAGLDYMPDHDLEKFAELIVKQCADIAGTAEPYQSSDLIKQHFGITE